MTDIISTCEVNSKNVTGFLFFKNQKSKIKNQKSKIKK
jgi:hypothetical protein